MLAPNIKKRRKKMEAYGKFIYEYFGLPTARCTKPQKRFQKAYASFEFTEVTEDEFPLAFEDTEYIHWNIRYHDGKFYQHRERELYDSLAEVIHWEGIRRQNRWGAHTGDVISTLPIVVESNEKKAVIEIQNSISKNFRIFNGQIWERTSEPCYYLTGNKFKGPIGTTRLGSAGVKKEDMYGANQLDLAEEHLRQKGGNVYFSKRFIKIHMPELITVRHALTV